MAAVEVSTLLNVSPERIHMHSQIIAMKCYFYMSWTTRDSGQFSTEVADLLMIFLTSINPLGRFLPKFGAFCLQLVLLTSYHNGTKRFCIYFLTLIGCCLFDSCQFIIDLCLVSRFLREIRNQTTRSKFVTIMCLAATLWYLIPIETVYFLILLFLAVSVNSPAYRCGMRKWYFFSAFILMCFHYGAIDLSCVLRPIMCLRRPFETPEKPKLTFLIRNINDLVGKASKI